MVEARSRITMRVLLNKREGREGGKGRERWWQEKQREMAIPEGGFMISTKVRRRIVDMTCLGCVCYERVWCVRCGKVGSNE